MRTIRCTATALLAVAGLTAAAFGQAHTDKTKEAAKPAAATQPAKTVSDAKSPEAGTGMTASMEAMMAACMEAGKVGKEHEHLAKSAGVWEGKVKHWMDPSMPAMESTCTTTITSIFEGRFSKSETAGDMPGMGKFEGAGFYGFDNSSKKYQSIWIDNMGTGMMFGTGELSADGKTMNWSFGYTCPMTKKPCVMREVERRTGDNTMVLEMHVTNPETGKEFKCMEISYTRKPGTTDKKPHAAAAPAKAVETASKK